MARPWFQENLCYRASPEVPLRQMRGQNPKLFRFADRASTDLALPFLSGEENRICKTIVSIGLLPCTIMQVWWGRPTNNGDRRARLHVGWEDFATFDKYGVISLKRYTIRISYCVGLTGCHGQSIEQ